MRNRAAMLAIAAFCCPVLASCTPSDSPGCQAGAESPAAAVTALLAAATTNDTRAACVVTVKISDQDLRANLAEIKAFVESVGGVDNLSTVDVPEAQVGQLHQVDVLAVDSVATVHFTVEATGSRYLVVSPPSDPLTDDETTDPNPRPSSSETGGSDA